MNQKIQRSSKLILSIMGLVLLLSAAAGWVIMDLYRFAHQPASPQTVGAIITVAPGETFNALTAELKRKNIITSEQRFKMLARFTGDDKRLKAGEYGLDTAMTPLQVLDELVTGRILVHRLTIPEGFTIAQIAAEVERSGLGQADTFKDMTADAQLIRDLGLEAPTLEGYLFPDTYYFSRGTSMRSMVLKMVAHFQEQFPPAWRQRAQELHLTVHQVVTLASIIEKETGDPTERPLIASVFLNRLKKKMRLESDPTVIYGIDQFDGNLTRRQLRTSTPYNTYVIKGLPPGPIANPGSGAIEAALYPAQTDYLFFVSKQDGTHYFSKSIQEHNEAVRKYQLRKRGH